MGLSKSVSVSELMKGNSRACLSAKRVFNKCYECPQYSNCESKIINKEYEKKQKQIAKLNQEKQRIEQEIKDLD